MRLILDTGRREHPPRWPALAVALVAVALATAFAIIGWTSGARRASREEVDGLEAVAQAERDLSVARQQRIDLYSGATEVKPWDQPRRLLDVPGMIGYPAHTIPVPLGATLTTVDHWPADHPHTSELDPLAPVERGYATPWSERLDVLFDRGYCVGVRVWFTRPFATPEDLAYAAGFDAARLTTAHDEYASVEGQVLSSRKWSTGQLGDGYSVEVTRVMSKPGWTILWVVR